ERVLEGDIERVGDQYRVRGLVGETWLPAGKAHCLCASMEDAYQQLRGRSNPDDPDERLRLANWCHQHRLARQALEEARQGPSLRPRHAASQRLVQRLDRRVEAASRPTPEPNAKPGEKSAEPGVPPVELHIEAVSQFATRVQPILMNTCACCHATAGKGGAYQLQRAHDYTLNGQKALQQNLAATLAQVNLHQPQSSPFLTKAVSVHGDSTQAPLKGRQLAAFHVLEDWVKLAARSHPASNEVTTTPPVTTDTKPAALAAP